MRNEVVVVFLLRLAELTEVIVILAPCLALCTLRAVPFADLVLTLVISLPFQTCFAAHHTAGMAGLSISLRLLDGLELPLLDLVPIPIGLRPAAAQMDGPVGRM